MKIHFIGIGGIGVSALAQYYLSKGHEVSGSDISNSEIVELVRKKGVKVTVGKHSARNIPKDIGLAVYSPAIEAGNPELDKCKKSGIKVLSYPEALGKITKEYLTIAVSGTHGKSTTSAIISLILLKSGLDPTVIIGTKMKELGNSNFQSGKSKYLVIEADEYKRSFLNYHPDIAVLTNIDKDHLDYYKDIEDIAGAFREYLKKVPKNGKIVANRDDKRLSAILKKDKRTIFYSLDQKESLKIRKNIRIPGNHNISNALAALETARILKVGDKKAFNAIFEYRGSWRRFETVRAGGITLISDYGHHPTEIEKTLQAAREKFPRKRILCVFQPHQYKRTLHLLDDFIKTLKEAPVDKMILCEIYGVSGREGSDIRRKISSKKIAGLARSRKILYKRTQNDAEKYLKSNLRKGDVLIIMGAGDIYNLFLKLASSLTK